jgi:alkaline ceramidase TOD1/glycosyltransferase MUCI70-like protein
VKVELYSAIYGAYDSVKAMPDIGVTCRMFTDSPRVAGDAADKGWHPVIVSHGIATLKGSPAVTAPMLAHKWWKTHPHLACPEADISLWLDGSMQIVRDDYVDLCLKALGEDDWSCVPHPARNCIFPEAAFSATLARYDAAAINAQAQHYFQFHPPNVGLIATGANVRRHTAEVIKVGEQWWDECVNWSHQDQLSLPVLLRLAQGKVRWNMNLPWFTWWYLHEHG